MLLPVPCGQEKYVVCQRVRNSERSLEPCAYGRYLLALLVYPSCAQGSGYSGVLVAGHAHRAEVGGGIYLRDLRGFTGLHKISSFFFLEKGSNSIGKMPFCWP